MRPNAGGISTQKRHMHQSLYDPQMLPNEHREKYTRRSLVYIETVNRAVVKLKGNFDLLRQVRSMLLVLITVRLLPLSAGGIKRSEKKPGQSRKMQSANTNLTP